MPKKIDFVDMTKPPDDQVDQEGIDKLIEQFSDIVFADCTRSGLMLGLDTESVAVAMSAAGEVLFWISKIAGKVDDDGLEKLRAKVAGIAKKRCEFFKDTGIEELMKSAGRIAQKMKEREQAQESCDNTKCDSDGGTEDDD